MHPTSPVIFYVPKNFDSSIFDSGCRDYAHYFLSLLRRKWVNWEADEKGYIRLRAEYITDMIPKPKWKIIREVLVGKAIIKHNPFYEPGAKSQSYCLGEKYRKTKRVECENSKLSWKIRRFDKDYNRACRIPVTQWLAKNLQRVSIDVSRAASIIQTMKPDSSEKMSVKDYRHILAESCATIHNGDLNLICDSYGRVHTPITSLAKELRCCLSIESEPLVSLDLANSQPLIAGLCAREFDRSGVARSRLLNRNFERGKNPYRFSVGGAKQTKPNPHIKDYLDLCERGQFYESLMEKGEDRGLFKTRFYQEVFFGRSRSNELNNRFTARHPFIAGMLRKMKETNYKRSAWIMQNFEAVIFIGTICKRIMRERPETVLLTIHDSLMMKKPDAPWVAKIVEEEFSKLGTTPSLKWEPESDTPI